MSTQQNNTQMTTQRTAGLEYTPDIPPAMAEVGQTRSCQAILPTCRRPCDRYNAKSHMMPWSPGDESFGSSSSHEGHRDSDNDGTAKRNYHLSQKHPFQCQRSDLLRLSNMRFKEWCVNEPIDFLQKKSSESKLQHNHSRLDRDNDQRDAKPVILSHWRSPERRFHLACPYYVLNSQKYRQCLLLYDQQSIESLIDHITQCHIKPFYCPICFTTCDTIMERDDHILERTCELRDLVVIEGIDYGQKLKLKRLDERSLGERERWQRIWIALFPRLKPPSSPYLDEGCGLAVSMARDFWATHGSQHVSEFIGDRNILDKHRVDKKEEEDALCELALGDLLNSLLEECDTSRWQFATDSSLKEISDPT